MWAWRPTKMCEEFVDLAKEYLETTWDEWKKYLKSYSNWEKSSWESFEYKLEVNLPSYAWLLVYLSSKGYRINRDTLFDWKNKWESEGDSENIFARFSDALMEINKLQEAMLLSWAISGKYNPIISKMLLNVNHGYKEIEKKEVEHSGEIKNTWWIVSALTGIKDKVVWK